MKAIRTESEALSTYFGLSYASWLTVPRVLLEAMPLEWQDQMGKLLHEYDAAFPNQPEYGTRVQVTDARGALIQTPHWVINYRHPDRKQIDKLRPSPKAKLHPVEWLLQTAVAQRIVKRDHLWFRIRYAYWIWRECHCRVWPSFAWDCATAFDWDDDYHGEPDNTPHDAVLEEMSNWEG